MDNLKAIVGTAVRKDSERVLLKGLLRGKKKVSQMELLMAL